MEEGSLWLALAVAAVLVGGTFLEMLWIRWGWAAYFRVALPLGAEPVPLPCEPARAEGRTGALEYRKVQPDLVLFWADRDARAAPTLLHGFVQLRPSSRGCALRVFWAPPWTPLFGAVWLMFLGVARGEAAVTVPIGMAMVLGMAVLYLRGARQAATELRWALARSEDDSAGDEG